VRVWDMETGAQVLGPLEGHTDWVLSVAISPDGRRIVSGSGDKTVRVWDMETGEQVLGPLEGHIGWVQFVAISPDGHRIVSGSHDKTVRVWDMETGAQVLDPLEGHTDQVRSVAISPDGLRIVSGSVDRSIRIWELPAGFDSNVENENAYYSDRDPERLDFRCYSSKSPDDDGWLTVPSGELVLWLPREYREGFGIPPNIAIIAPSIVTTDLGNWTVHGTEWARCYTPRQSSQSGPRP